MITASGVAGIALLVGGLAAASGGGSATTDSSARPLAEAPVAPSTQAVGLPQPPIDTAPQGATPVSVEERLALLAEEVRRLREQIALPTTDAELTSAHGMGPAASKVYHATSGLSLGGYGEFYFEAPVEQTDATGLANTADLYRFISYVGYKFGPRIVMNTELEFEHATTGANAAGRAGEVSVEFSYLDFLLSPGLNVRAGSLLLPMGLINTMHEPVFYRGNLRPEVEQRILPSTWREMGIAAHGQVGHSWRYEAALVNGLNAKKFSDSGIRDGRQKGNRAVWEDLAAVVAAEWTRQDRLLAGGSLYFGESDQHQPFAGESIDARTVIIEAHAQVRHRSFQGRALFAALAQDAAAAITRDIYPSTGSGASSRLVPERQWGFYLEAAYDLAPLLGLPLSCAVSPWARVESYDLQARVPEVERPGEIGRLRAANDKLAGQSLTVGVEVKPTPTVVLKAEAVHLSNRADAPESDRVRFGAGFVF